MSKVLIILGTCVAIAFFGGFAWQQAEKNSNEDDAARHERVASTLDSAVADGVEAGNLMTQYVQTGDETLLPQMQARADDGVRKLTAAITEADGDPNSFVATGSSIIQRTGEIIALRQAGDVAGAGAALTALGTEFTAFVQAQQAFIASERDAAAASSASADDAGQLATWFLLAGAFASLAVAGGIGVSVFRRKGREGPAGAVPA